MRRFSTFLLLFALAAGLPAAGQMGRSRRGGAQQQPGQGSASEEVLADFSGTLLGIDSKKLTLDQPDSNALDFICSKKTKYYDGSKKIKPSDLKPGDMVSVEARLGIDGALEAVNVHREHPKPKPAANS
jgi:hypothetical protein